MVLFQSTKIGLVRYPETQQDISDYNRFKRLRGGYTSAYSWVRPASALEGCGFAPEAHSGLSTDAQFQVTAEVGEQCHGRLKTRYGTSYNILN